MYTVVTPVISRTENAPLWGMYAKSFDFNVDVNTYDDNEIGHLNDN